jgi:16S rRNA U1498 N3-methylase RsmE
VNVNTRLVVVQRVDTADAGALAVAELTGLHADEIAPLASEPHVLRKLPARLSTWRAVAREAADRSGRQPPRIDFVYGFVGLSRRIEWGAPALILDPAATTSLSTVDIPEGELVLVAGCRTEQEMAVLDASPYVRRVRPEDPSANAYDTAVAAAAALARRLA